MPHAVAERRDPAVRLLPDLPSEPLTVVGDDVRVVELVGRIVTRPRGELGRARDHVLDVLRRDLRRALDRLDRFDVGPERAHQLEALLGEAVRDDDQRL